MLSRLLPLCAALFFVSAARAQLDTESLKQAARDAGKNAASHSEAKARGAAKKAGSQQLEKQINEKLLEEARKNQCAF